MINYIHQLPDWPNFYWDKVEIANFLTDVRFKQGVLLGRMNAMGFDIRKQADFQTRTLDVLNTSEIEGDNLDAAQVRSSVAKRLGLNIARLVKSDRHVDAIVDMMLDATSAYTNPLTDVQLFNWHETLFPESKSGMRNIITGKWRDNPITDPMQVLSGPIGKEKIHFQAPDSDKLENEMARFLEWYNNERKLDTVLKSGVAHLWFITIHPFDDGNGRIARALADRLLSIADETGYRFYSMSAQIRKERNEYYDILERTQRGSLDITEWLRWYLMCLARSFTATEEVLETVLHKAGFWAKHGKSALNARQVKVLNRLLEGFDGKLNTTKWARLTKCSHDTALRDIHELMDKKILIKEDTGGRSTHYALQLKLDIRKESQPKVSDKGIMQ